ncbi:site-specific integrase [Pseudomonas syringae]|uniref:site-specific integrase n=1 Tax=Pseudomonas syringae TaxID=317 RepID=UPI001379622A|nr:site-specific integrase [Pseudomonas syringae]
MFLVSELKSAVRDDDFEKLVATYYVASDKTYVPASLFTDMRWRLPDNIFPPGTNESTKWLDFEKLPEQFMKNTKIAVLRYIRGLGKHRRQRRGKSVVSVFDNIRHFERFIAPLATSFPKVNNLISSHYANDLKTVPRSSGKLLSNAAVRARLNAVELLHELTKDLSDGLPKPWSNTSSYQLSGGSNERGYVSTEYIPDDTLAILFKSAADYLERGDSLLHFRDYHLEMLSKKLRYSAVRDSLKYFSSNAYNRNLQQLRNDISDTLSACIVIILTCTGIRSNELLSLTTDSCYQTIEDDQTIFWIRGSAEGTPRVWIANSITHKAINLAIRITAPLRSQLISYIDESKKNNIPESLFNKALIHRNSIFLGGENKEHIQTFANPAVNDRLKRFASLAKLDWNLASHQFRPTFAAYVVRSKYGDIRYLKEHFGHFDIDTTVSYSKHEHFDESLIEAIGFAYSEYQYATYEHMLLDTTPLAGGLAHQIKKLRQEIKTYKNRKEMIKSVINSIFLRATSVGWCANDKGDCIGGDGPEKTRCAADGGCCHFITDDTKLPVFKDIEYQQLELIDLVDIGESGRLRAARDLERCRSIIGQLKS